MNILTIQNTTYLTKIMFHAGVVKVKCSLHGGIHGMESDLMISFTKNYCQARLLLLSAQIS